jgi:hypothetical protein
MVKTGYGEKEGTHAYLGFRYVTTATKLGAADTLKAPGAGLETQQTTALLVLNWMEER